MFNQIQQSTITRQIIHQIHTAIIAGKLSPGDKLPSENNLIKQFGISKQTLRESLRALEHMGLIESRKGTGGGSFVIEVDAAITKLGLLNYFYFQNLSIKDLSMVRKLIEPFTARVAAETMEDEDILELEALNISAGKHIENKNHDSAMADLIALHVKIAQQTNNPLIVLLMEFMEDILVDYKQVFQVNFDEIAVILKAHEKICAAIKNRDKELASKEMLAHIDALEDTLVPKENNLSLKEVYSKTKKYNYNR